MSRRDRPSTPGKPMPEPAPTALPPAPRLSLLGGFDLRCCGGSVRLSPSGQRVLAFLALHRRRRVPRALLAERLWAYTDPTRAASSLRSALWRLPRPHRRSLIVSGATSLELAPHVEVDLWQTQDDAEALAAGSGPAAAGGGLREALGRDLLPEWAEDWLLVEQESFRQLRLHALEAVSATLLAAGRHPAALLAALTAVRAEPLRETAHRRVIEVHLAEGNAAEALRQYQLYRRLLADDLGLAPSPTLRRLVLPLLGRPVDAEHREAGHPEAGHPEAGHSEREHGDAAVVAAARGPRRRRTTAGTTVATTSRARR